MYIPSPHFETEELSLHSRDYIGPKCAIVTEINTSLNDKIRFELQKALAHARSIVQTTSGVLRLNVLVSGGVDSVALLHMLNMVKRNQKLELEIVHFVFDDFPEHEETKELVLSYATEYDLPIHFIPISSSTVTSNRKDFIHKVFKCHSNINNPDFIVTAHHQDDVYETCLYRLFSGRAGLYGLKPFKTVSEQFVSKVRSRYLRPLLNVSKSDLIDFSRMYQLHFIHDSTNDDSDADRNFIRNEVIPVLKKRFEPRKLVRSLYRMDDVAFGLNETPLNFRDTFWSLTEFNKLNTEQKYFIIKQSAAHNFAMVFNERVAKKLKNFLKSNESGVFSLSNSNLLVTVEKESNIVCLQKNIKEFIPSS